MGRMMRRHMRLAHSHRYWTGAGGEPPPNSGKGCDELSAAERNWPDSMATGKDDRLVQFRTEQTIHGVFNLLKRHALTMLKAVDKIGQFDIFHQAQAFARAFVHPRPLQCLR